MSFVDRVVDLFHEIGIEGFRADSITVIGLTQSAMSVKDLRMMKSVHSLGIKIGLEIDVSVCSIWYGWKAL